MIQILALLGMVALITGAGAAIGAGLRRGGEDAPLGIGWSYLLGTAAIAGVLHIPLAIDGKISHLSFALVALSAAILSAGFVVWRYRSGTLRAERRLGWLFDLPILLRVAVCVMLAAAFGSALAMPPNTYDGRAAFGLKAQVLYDVGTIRNEDFEDVNRLHFNAHYPLLTSLLEAECFWAQGSMDDHAIRVIFAMFVVALLSVVIEELGRYMSRRAAALWGLLLMGTPMILSTFEGGGLSASVDIPFACFVTAAVIEMGHWLHTQAWRRLLTAGLMLGAAALTKGEGMIWIAAVAFALGLLLWRRRTQLPGVHWKSVVPGAAVLLGMIALSTLARREIPVSPYLREYGQALRLEWLVQVWRRPVDIAQYTVEEAFNLERWALLWPCVLVGFVLLRRRASVSPAVWFARAVVLLIVAADFAIFTITPYHLQFHLRTALCRLALHFTPLTTLLLAEQFQASTMVSAIERAFHETPSLVEREGDNSELETLDGRKIPSESRPQRKAA